MFKSMRYVIKENVTNLYRIFCIAKYELLGEMRDSKFGIFWNFASPAIQVFTFYLVFGLAMGRKPQGGVPYLPWVIVGFCAWWFIQPCIVQGCSAIFSKVNVITKMKFPVSILPMTVIGKELFNHFCMMCIAIVVLCCYGYYPNVYWLGTIYYLLCIIALLFSLSLITSVLTMIWRDVKKLVSSMMRMLLYMSLVLFNDTFHNAIITIFIKLNPVAYIVQGYRDCILYQKSIFAHPALMLYFWILILVLFSIGSYLMYKFKTKFIDLV